VAYEGIVKLLKPNMEWEDPYPFFLLMLGAEKKIYIYIYIYIYVRNYIVRSAKGRIIYPIRTQYVGLISVATSFITISLPLLLL